jgi:hypothetical protein
MMVSQQYSGMWHRTVWCIDSDISEGDKVTQSSGYAVWCHISDHVITVMRHVTMLQSTSDRLYNGGENFWELDKLIVEGNYLLEQISNMGETSLFWKWMPERTFIHKGAKSMPGLKLCVSVTFAQQRNRLTTYFSEHIPVIMRWITVSCDQYPVTYLTASPQSLCNVLHDWILTYCKLTTLVFWALAGI